MTEMAASSLTISDRALAIAAKVESFVRETVVPFERDPRRDHHGAPTDELVMEMREHARAAGVLTPHILGDGDHLNQRETAVVLIKSGLSPLGPLACNTMAPDEGNMYLLGKEGSPELKERFLNPMVEGRVRSAFFMTEPGVASSDARNIQSRIVRDGDDYVVNGRKWWSSGAASPRCKVGIFMGVTDPDEQPYRQQSMILVPMDTPGVRVVRELPVFGHYDGQGGHPEVEFVDVRVPAANLIGQEGDGFRIAQERLGPGRIHHCMRLIGMAERAFDLMCERAIGREAFGQPIARQGVFQHWIAQARVKIEQARLLTLKAAHLMDTVGNKGARMEISAIKIVAPSMAEWVLDKAIQTHGGAGFTNDTPLAMMWAHARTLRMADGPDEVHEMALARRELKRYLPQD
jgi:acyl-CoA dehydrogenase